LYARVSTSDQTCEQQLTDLREYAAARQWEIQGEYVDRGVSGTKDTRPAMSKLLDAARRRAIDCIIVWKLDRWGRSMPRFVQSVQELRGLGVRFIAMTQGIDTGDDSPTGRLMMTLLAAFSEFERELIVERTRAGLQRARAAGRVGGRPKAVFDRAKVHALRAQGLSVGAISVKMGVPKTSIHRALQEPLTVASTPSACMTAVQADVVSALVNLGSTRTQAERAVHGVAGVDFDSLLRAALQSVRTVA
jgi:DNA invertase Pin-like site-specific DNA recombinase